MEESAERHLKVTKRCNIASYVTKEDESYISGGVLSDHKVAWISCGPRLTTINCDDGSKRTGWTFGWVSQDNTYKIVCVEELCVSTIGSPILIVASESETAGSSISFYHSGSSRILKCIRFTEKITSVTVVSKFNDLEENISNILKPWSGIAAVGTATGKVYLLDIWWKGLEKCIDDYKHKYYDEQKQSKISELSIQDLVNTFDFKASSLRHGSTTLALWLNEETLRWSRSSEHPGVQNLLGPLPRDQLAVTALKYLPQVATLAVGYNTSCFQLWDLSTLTILYTSRLLETMAPVYSFSFLEPADDPKYVCFLWTTHHSEYDDSLPLALMYKLSYHDKHLNDFNTHSYYEGFSSCTLQYELCLGLEMEDVLSGRIISTQSLHRSNTKTSALWSLNDTEDGASEDGTACLLAITWEVWLANQPEAVQRLTLFDLNQYYRQYMPASTEIDYSQFITHFCLPDGPMLDVRVLAHTVRQFGTLQVSEEHFYPSAISFECQCLQRTQIWTCVHLGMQEECLQALQEAGPSGLLLPARLYKMCIRAGMRPLLSADVSSPNSSHSKEQREFLLSMALEYGMTQYLRHCVRDWSDGSHAVAGCTLPSLLLWAWGRVQRYKKWLDGLCVPLFNYSGIALDSNDLGVFHHMVCLLHSLHDLFKLVLEKYRNCILEGNFEQQHMAINLVTAFYDSVLWCVKNKVLPETNVGDIHINGHIPYFTEKIVNSTISRRAELHHLAKSLKHPVPTSGLLLIDALITQEAEGNKLTDQWEREGGSTTVGKYPPPSVQSLLRTYLIRGIPLHVKHFIVSYFLYDIVQVIKTVSLNESTKEKLLKYPSDFGLSESQCKIVEAFWCLDHKKYEDGVRLLLEGCVDKEDLQVYQHRTIVCVLVASGNHKLALHYLNVRRPCLSEVQDIRMKMTLLLVNNLIHEAYEFQKHHQFLNPELLEQFFTGCVEMNKLDFVFKLPLNQKEEEAFMTFLSRTSHPQADDFRVLYLLSRSRYSEAIDLNDKLRLATGARGRGTAGLPLGHSPLGQSPLGPRGRSLFGPRNEVTGAPVKAVLTTRDLIVNSVAKSLPSITRELADFCAKEKNFKWKQVERPTPLSVLVHTELNNERLPVYKTTDNLLVAAALSKTRELWAPLLATPAALKRKLNTAVEDTPFLRTPLIQRLDSSVSK